jgi:hypothetical protein
MKASNLSPLELVWEARRKTTEEAGGTIEGLARYYTQHQKGVAHLVGTKEQVEEIARRQESELSVKPPRPPKVRRSDPIIDEIRAVRKKIWTDCDEDPEKFFNYMKKADARIRVAEHQITSQRLPAFDHDEPIALKEKPARKYGKH